MNKKYKLLTITLFVFFSGILVTISNMTKSGNVNCSGTLQMNSPGDQEFLFNGTISVVIRPGTEILSVSLVLRYQQDSLPPSIRISLIGI